MGGYAPLLYLLQHYCLDTRTHVYVFVYVCTRVTVYVWVYVQIGLFRQRVVVCVINSAAPQTAKSFSHFLAAAKQQGEQGCVERQMTH